MQNDFKTITNNSNKAGVIHYSGVKLYIFEITCELKHYIVGKMLKSLERHRPRYEVVVSRPFDKQDIIRRFSKITHWNNCQNRFEPGKKL